MFKTTSTLSSLSNISFEVCDWACSEKNGRFSRLYRVVVSISQLGWREGLPVLWEPVFIAHDMTWSDALKAIEEQMYQVITFVDEDAFFLSNPGDSCERFSRAVNAILPSHDLKVWSNGK